MYRPTKQRTVRTQVDIQQELARKARIICADRNASLPSYINQVLEEVIERDYRQALEGMRESVIRPRSR